MSEWAIPSFFFLLVLFSNKSKPTKMKIRSLSFSDVFYNIIKTRSESDTAFSINQGELIR